MSRKKIVAISGSTRQNSTNHALIKAIADISAEHFEVTIYEGIGMLPQFNPNEDNENVPKEVMMFRNVLDDADGVIICTPEYAHGVPGTLKNAIDWTISTSQFPGKPVMLITASTDGRFGHQAMLEILKAIDANFKSHEMVIQFAKTKISADNKIIDENIFVAVKDLSDRFIDTLNR